MNSRHSILRGQKPNASHLGALQQADATLRNVRQNLISSYFHPYQNGKNGRLGRPSGGEHAHQELELTTQRQELLAITDAYVDNTLRSADASQGKWLNEDPTLAQIQQILMSRR